MSGTTLGTVAGEAGIRQAMRCRVVAGGAALSAGAEPGAPVLRHLPAGMGVVAARVAGHRVRLASPAGWVDAAALEPAAPLPERVDFATFVQRHEQPWPGDRYGIVLPRNLAGLREAGPEFLTAAFRAAGTIAPDNSVTAIVALDPLGIPGASENGLLTVSYARDEPGLSRELFVKVPPADAEHAYRQVRGVNGETTVMRMSAERALPITVPRCYFADHSDHTGNFVLITARIGFGTGTIEEAWRKGEDFRIPEADVHYDRLVEALAAMGAAHKTGALGDDFEDLLPYGGANRLYPPIPDPRPQLERIAAFVGTTAPQLFTPAVTDPDLLARWCADSVFGLGQCPAIVAHLLADPDYTAFCHPNLNIDNAWYWRDAAGTLQVGLLDWGGAGQMGIAQALCGMLMMPEPPVYRALVARMIDRYIALLVEGGGPRLDRGTLVLQYKASLFTTAVGLFVTILADVLDRLPGEFVASLTSRDDPRLHQSGLRSAVVWIDNVLQEWLDPLTPGDAARRIVGAGG